MNLRALTVGVLVGGITLAGGCPAGAAPADQPADQRADQPAVSLVVGLRAATDVVATLERSVDVMDSEPLAGAVTVDVPADQVAEATDVLRADPAVAYVERDGIARAATVTPDDPAFAAQWGIKKAGVDTAWETTRGSGAIIVAVVDTGVKVLPDLAGRVLPGRDFVNKDSNATDDQGHGTMTAGVIAARGDNGTGIAGICWTCQILPVKVLDAQGSGSYSDIAAGIRWSADRGADIVNLSLGGDSDSRLLRDAVAYATGKGALVIAAAGNEGSAVPHFPAAIPAVLAVGASTTSDSRYSWSNYGSSWVDIAAPGCNPAQARNGVVGQFCGTSSATPVVAGIAALLASTTPTPTAATMRTALTSSADKISGSWVPTSAGRVNAAAALASLPVTDDHVSPATSFLAPSGNALVRGTVAVSASATDDIGVAKVLLLADGVVVGTDRVAPYGFAWKTSGRGGSVTLGLRTYDRGGNVISATRQVMLDNWGPAIRITGPASGTRHVRKTRYVAATAADTHGVTRLELLVDGKVTQRYVGSTRRFAVQTWKHGAVMTVQVRAYDKAGNVRYAPARKWYR
ncbi:S8 family serine peptidase [Actinoplanes sp. NPDC049599]|uniref:S8 family serine peptidase n=1 Tax=Actinoplanes sp. NPDC049599 TaxID=3363903 RepID=UPI0037B858ED